MSYICVSYNYIPGWREVNWKNKMRQSRAETRERCWLRHVWADESEQTGYWIGALKRQELKQNMSDGGEIQCCKNRMQTFSSSYPKYNYEPQNCSICLPVEKKWTKTTNRNLSVPRAVIKNHHTLFKGNEISGFLLFFDTWNVCMHTCNHASS